MIEVFYLLVCLAADPAGKCAEIYQEPERPPTPYDCQVEAMKWAQHVLDEHPDWRVQRQGCKLIHIKDLEP